MRQFQTSFLIILINDRSIISREEVNKVFLLFIYYKAYQKGKWSF